MGQMVVKVGSEENAKSTLRWDSVKCRAEIVNMAGRVNFVNEGKR